MNTQETVPPLPDKSKRLAWDIDVGLLNNRMIWKAFLTMIIATYVVVMVLMGFIMAAQGEADTIPALAGMFALVCAGLFVLMLLIMLILFGNRMRMRFVLDERRVRTELTDRRAKAGNRIAAVAGALSGKPGLAGAGLIGMSDEVREYEWRQIVSAKFDERRRVITLANDWHAVAYLFCTPETWPAASEMVQRLVATKGKKEPGRGWRYPLVQPLLLTLGVLAALIPLFAMPYPFEVHLFALIFTLCFALATVWIIPLLAYAVLAGVAWMVFEITARGLEEHQSQFGDGPWTGFSSLYGDEWVTMGLAVAGLLFLVWMSVAMLRGKLTSLLVRERTE